jgi:hypothetical protein
MNQDFDHQLADHLLARERATRAREEPLRDPSPRPARDTRFGGDGLARRGRVAHGAALLTAWFK